MIEILQQLGLNSTIVWEFFIFLVVFAFLKHLYFLPFQKLFAVRKEKTEGFLTQANTLDQDSETRLKKYQERVHSTHAELTKERDQVLLKIKQEESKALSAARDQSRQITLAAIEAATKDRDGLKISLQKESEALVKSVIAKILPRRVG